MMIALVALSFLVFCSGFVAAFVSPFGDVSGRTHENRLNYLTEDNDEVSPEKCVELHVFKYRLEEMEDIMNGAISSYDDPNLQAMSAKIAFALQQDSNRFDFSLPIQAPLSHWVLDREADSFQVQFVLRGHACSGEKEDKADSFKNVMNGFGVSRVKIDVESKPFHPNREPIDEYDDDHFHQIDPRFFYTGSVGLHR